MMGIPWENLVSVLSGKQDRNLKEEKDLPGKNEDAIAEV
jgi:hypothetical protein